MTLISPPEVEYSIVLQVPLVKSLFELHEVPEVIFVGLFGIMIISGGLFTLRRGNDNRLSLRVVCREF